MIQNESEDPFDYAGNIEEAMRVSRERLTREIAVECASRVFQGTGESMDLVGLEREILILSDSIARYIETGEGGK